MNIKKVKEIEKRELNKGFNGTYNPNNPSKENDTPPAPKFEPQKKDNK